MTRKIVGREQQRGAHVERDEQRLNALSRGVLVPKCLANGKVTAE